METEILRKERASKKYKERFNKVSKTDVKLPEDNYYAIAVGFTQDGGVYIM